MSLRNTAAQLKIQLDNYANNPGQDPDLADQISKTINIIISEIFDYYLLENQILIPAKTLKNLQLSNNPPRTALRYNERIKALIDFIDILDLYKVNKYRSPFYIKMILENEEEINRLSGEKKQQLIKRIIAQADKDFLDFQKQVFYNKKVDDNYYAMYLGLLMQLAGKDNFNENIQYIADNLKLSTKGKTQEQILKEIDILLETVDVKPSVKSFSFESERVEIKLPEDLYNPLREMIRSVMEIKDISEIIKGLQKRVKQIDDDIKKSNKDSLIKLGVPAGLINSNIKDKDLRIKEFIFKNKFELSPEELNALVQLAFLKTGNENFDLINNFAAGRELSVEDMNTLLTVLSELEGSEKEGQEEEEVQRGLIDALKDVDVEMLLGSVKKSNKWQLITRLKQAKIENKNVQNKVSKNIEVVFAQKNILDLFQGKFSGTCFGDCPYDMARPQIMVAKILDDKKLAGGILFYVLDNKLIMIGFDPSEALVGSLSSEKKNELIDYLMKSVYGFAKENNFELYITNEAGGLSNRAGFEEYIINNYMTTTSEQVKDKTGRKIKLKFHPNYEYEVRNINPALDLEKTPASNKKIKSSEKSVEEQSKTSELTRLKREELEVKTKLERLDNLWFWQKWFRNVPKEKAELNERLQKIKSSITSLEKEPTLEIEKQDKPQVEMLENIVSEEAGKKPALNHLVNEGFSREEAARFLEQTAISPTIYNSLVSRVKGEPELIPAINHDIEAFRRITKQIGDLTIDDVINALDEKATSISYVTRRNIPDSVGSDGMILPGAPDGVVTIKVDSKGGFIVVYTPLDMQSSMDLEARVDTADKQINKEKLLQERLLALYSMQAELSKKGAMKPGGAIDIIRKRLNELGISTEGLNNEQVRVLVNNNIKETKKTHKELMTGNEQEIGFASYRSRTSGGEFKLTDAVLVNKKQLDSLKKAVELVQQDIRQENPDIIIISGRGGDSYEYSMRNALPNIKTERVLTSSAAVPPGGDAYSRLGELIERTIESSTGSDPVKIDIIEGAEYSGSSVENLREYFRRRFMRKDISKRLEITVYTFTQNQEESHFKNLGKLTLGGEDLWESRNIKFIHKRVDVDFVLGEDSAIMLGKFPAFYKFKGEIKLKGHAPLVIFDNGRIIESIQPESTSSTAEEFSRIIAVS